MPQIIPRPPASIHETTIFKRIPQQADPDGLYSKVNRFLDAAVPLVDSIISGPFKQYTLHNRDHAKKLIHLAEYIIEPRTVESLTPFDCVLIIYASYLHDMGLSLTEEELRSVLRSETFANHLLERPQLRAALEAKRAQLRGAAPPVASEIELDIADLHSVALTSFLRPLHATRERYRQLIAQIRSTLSGDDPFSIRGVPFEEELIDICVSHNLDATVLAQMRTAHEERFPRNLVISDHNANTQFVAAVLRLTDILDCDFERTPRILFDSLGIRDPKLPEAEVSLREWERHLAVQQLEMRSDELVITATCRHPTVEATVREFGRLIEQEIQETLAVLRRNPAEVADTYQLRLPTTVRCEIRARGYVYMDLSIRLDEAAVTGLLMGTRLYPSEYACVRELIQNGLDACSVRRHLGGDVGYRPTIEVSEETEADGSTWLVVRDNGIGMTEEVLKSHFFRVGSSFYSSPAFDRLLGSRNLGRIPLISRFGIGFISVFMLGDAVQVETRRMSMSGAASAGWRVTVHQHGALAYVQADNTLPEGTTVRIRLKSEGKSGANVLDRVTAYLRDNVLRPPIDVDVRLGEHRFRIGTRMFAEPRERFADAKESRRILSRLKLVRIDSEEFTSHCRGPIYLLFARVPGSDELDCRLDSKPIELNSDVLTPDRVRVHPKWLFSNFGGNQITVGGFRMTLSRLNKLLRRGEFTIPAVYDLDLTPGPLVDFDVARTKVRDETLALRQELRRVISEGLKRQGVYDRLTARTKRAVDGKHERGFWEIGEEQLRYKSAIVSDEQLLSNVRSLLPADSWPAGIHRTIATQLNISNRLAFNAISTLLVEGRVAMPKKASS
jgi:molecular chaperone HtpG